MVDVKVDERSVYEAGDAQKTILGLSFLIFLPFLTSIPIMFLKRGLNGFFWDAISAAVLGVLLAAWLGYLLVQVMSSMRTRIAFEDEGLRLRVPIRRGPSPSTKYLRTFIPYDEVQAVETRCEVFTALQQVPVCLEVASVLKTDGERVVLGYQHVHEEDPDIDYKVIAKQLARVADVPLVDKGKVKVGSALNSLRKGETLDWDAPDMGAEAYEKLRRRNVIIMTGLTFLILALFTAGLAYDLYRSDALEDVVQGITSFVQTGGTE